MAIQIITQMGLMIAGIMLVFLIKVAKFKDAETKYKEIFYKYLFSIIWATVAGILIVALIQIVPDFTDVLRIIGANIELPNGELNNSSFVLLGATLFYFVNDSQGKKE